MDAEIQNPRIISILQRHHCPLPGKRALHLHRNPFVLYARFELPSNPFNILTEPSNEEKKKRRRRNPAVATKKDLAMRTWSSDVLLASPHPSAPFAANGILARRMQQKLMEKKSEDWIRLFRRRLSARIIRGIWGLLACAYIRIYRDNGDRSSSALFCLS